MYKIMIVDDEPLAQSSLVNYVHREYPELEIVSVCGNGNEAYEEFIHNPADILLTDIRMPVMDGLDLIQKLQEESYVFVPIIISGYNDFTYAKTAMRMGVIYYLLKPIDFVELNQSIDSSILKIRQYYLMKSNQDSFAEEQELFLVDLIRGHFLDFEDLVQEFDKNNFPFLMEQSNGVYMRISLNKSAENWTYERETLSNVFVNLIRMIYRPKFVTTVFRTLNNFDIILFCPEEDLSIGQKLLNEQVENSVKLEIDIINLLVFHSIKDFVSMATKENEMITGRLDIKEAQNLIIDKNITAQDEIYKAIAYMKEHYAEDLTREEIAEKVYMSSAHFSRCFKKVTGMKFIDYLTEVRMQQALLLLNTNMKVQDIGKMVGYPSRNRFFINFRNYTSYTPTEYRRIVLKMMC